MHRFAALIRDMVFKGQWKSVIRFLADEVKRQTSIRDYLTGQKVRDLLTKAKDQLMTYAGDHRFLKRYKRNTLKRIALVFHGWELTALKEYDEV